MIRTGIAGLLVAMYCAPLSAQTLTDGLMMPRENFCTGVLYTSDRWTNYWEGSLKRENGNIGTITTQMITWVGNYGVTDRLNVVAMLPHVSTEASQGTLRGMAGLQDLTLAVKYQWMKQAWGPGQIRGFAVANFSTPVSNYTPDYLPLSIGLGSTNAGGRITLYYRAWQRWFANASAGYTWRSNVELDRPSYYTSGQLHLTSEVWMPNVFDSFISAGYHFGPLQAELNLSLQRTLGGDDIRRQDMPFVSNRMDFARAGALVMYYLPAPRYLAVRGGATYAVSGRNVGQSTTLMAGLLYTLVFEKNKE